MTAALVLGSAAVVSSLGALWWALSGPRPVRARVDLTGAIQPPVDDLRTMALRRGAHERAVEPLMVRLGRLAQRYTPQGRIAGLERRLLLAGTPAGWTVERVLAAKVLIAAGGGALGLLRLVASPSAFGLMLLLALVGLGFFAPDLILRLKADERRDQVRRTLADAIDQLTVTVQAGLGLDAAMARVAARTRGPLGYELARVGQDVRAGMARSAALAAMADRVQVPELRHVVLALAQADRLGVPVARTLQVQAAELRVKRRQYAEEQAMKLPVKILFPTVLCILPALFVVVLGPAAISIYENLVRG
ncbi:MAG TPA: type II secretion system F family protein [Acidimicrobiales bacterium]